MSLIRSGVICAAVCLFSSVASAQVEQATAVVVDSSGSVVGRVIDLDGVHLALSDDGQPGVLLYFGVPATDISNARFTGPYFASNDCTGPRTFGPKNPSRRSCRRDRCSR